MDRRDLLKLLGLAPVAGTAAAKQILDSQPVSVDESDEEPITETPTTYVPWPFYLIRSLESHEPTQPLFASGDLLLVPILLNPSGIEKIGLPLAMYTVAQTSLTSIDVRGSRGNGFTYDFADAELLPVTGKRLVSVMVKSAQPNDQAS